MSKAVYVPMLTQVPICEEQTTTTTFQLSAENLDTFFEVTQGGTASDQQWVISNGGTRKIKLVPGNIGVHNTTASITLKAKRQLTNVVVSGIYYTEQNYDKITLKANGSTRLDAVSGSSALTNRWTGTLTSGSTIELTYKKDGSTHADDENYTAFFVACDNVSITTTETVITGYETMDATRKVKKMYAVASGETRKVKKGYVAVNGKTRLFFTADALIYTGQYTQSDVSMDGGDYILYTLITSGTLTLNENARYWMCGGGADGGTYYTNSRGGGTYGSGGGGGYTDTGDLNTGVYVVTIGAGGSGDTKIGNLTANGAAVAYNEVKHNDDRVYRRPDGGSGGGGGGGGEANGDDDDGGAPAPGIGAGTSTKPFGILDAHCGGGGGGSAYESRGDDGNPTGGAGGSDGGNGAAGSLPEGSVSSMPAALGGVKGGGNGGVFRYGGIASPDAPKHPPENATFYGSGGGGGCNPPSSDYDVDVVGLGYQGVAYILVPA